MNQPDPLALLEGALRIPSLSGDERAVAEYFVAQMRALGMQAHVDAAGNAVGELGAGPPVVLLGHIDTVPGQVPVRMEGGRLYGRGAVDAKGPFATFVAAAGRLAAAPPSGYRLVLVGAVEEEAASSKGAHYVVDKYAPLACIIGEPSGWDRLTLGYKGRLLAEGRWQQPMAHTAGREIAVAERAVAFWNALAAECAARNAGKARVFDQISPSIRSFHTGSDGMADWADMSVGLRLPPGADPAELAERLGELAHQHAGFGGPPELRFRGGCAAYQGDKNNPLVRAMLKGLRAAGGAPGFLLKTGTSDMNVVGPAWRCPILAYGPGDSALDHTPDEHVLVDEYLRAIDALELALRSLQL